MNYFFVFPFVIFIAFCLCFLCARRRRRGRRIGLNENGVDPAHGLSPPPFAEPAYDYYPTTNEGVPLQRYGGVAPPLVVGAPLSVTRADGSGGGVHSEESIPVPVDFFPPSNVFLEYVPTQPTPARVSPGSSPSSSVSVSRLGPASGSGKWIHTSSDSRTLPPVQYPLLSSGSASAFSGGLGNAKKNNDADLDRNGLINAQFLPEPDENDRRAVYGDGATYLPNSQDDTQRSSSTQGKKNKKKKSSDE